ncbi:MAG: PQQ-dependent sugar dehydrogenase, partial [Pyrinomonadaceae bacterium]
MKQKMFFIGLVCVLTTVGSDSFGQVPATRLQTRLSGLSSPIFVTNAGDGSKRLFIVERAGIIKIVQPGSNVTTNFLNITSRTTTDGERGLLGMAFHPNYETNRRFFVYYTRASDGAIHIGEYQASAGDSNV